MDRLVGFGVLEGEGDSGAEPGHWVSTDMYHQVCVLLTGSVPLSKSVQLSVLSVGLYKSTFISLRIGRYQISM